MAKNEGKRFEEAFVKSIPEYVLSKRLNDSTGAWSGGANTRFASNNECDFILYNDITRIFYGLELKSTKYHSLTYWREDFEDKNKKQSFQIRRCQIEGLKKWSRHRGIFGFVINFRDSDNKTYFVHICEFLKYTAPPFAKKSISKQDIIKMNHIEIESEILVSNYRYDIEKFLKDAEYIYGKLE